MSTNHETTKVSLAKKSYALSTLANTVDRCMIQFSLGISGPYLDIKIVKTVDEFEKNTSAISP
jgi:hypothetical protein